jgi:hypothetical protein
MKLLVGLLFFFSIIKAGGQRAETIAYTSASDSLLSVYQATLGSDLPLYNGRQFYGYYKLTKESPFYPEETQWNIGSVQYENMWYRNVPLMYDIYKDEVIIKHNRGPYILYRDRVQEFSILDKVFIRIDEDKKNGIATEGFYQRLSTGKITMFAKRIKKTEEDKSSAVLEIRFIFKTRFYILKDGHYSLISSRKSLLTLLNDKSSELRQYIKKAKLKYRANRELYITQVADFYNKLYK